MPAIRPVQRVPATSVCCSSRQAGFHLCKAFAARSRTCIAGLRRSVLVRASLPDAPNAEPVLDISLKAPRSGVPAEAADASTSGRGAINAPRSELRRALSKPGLRQASLVGGVKNATLRYDLPPPALAVRNLVEQAQFAHLCTLMSNMHHRRAGYPFGTLVDFASDGAGFPIFCLSPLAIHTRNIMEDARCSLVVQLPGWTGLANARVTIFGDVYQLPPNMQIFLEKQAAEKKQGWVLGNFMFFRMHRISDIYFVGGFGTVQWVDVAEYASTIPDSIVLHEPQKTLQARLGYSVLNERHSEAVRKLVGKPNQPADDAAFISIDRLGADVRVRHGTEYSVERLGFDFHVHSLDDALAATQQLVDHGPSKQPLPIHGHTTQLG